MVTLKESEPPGHGNNPLYPIDKAIFHISSDQKTLAKAISKGGGNFAKNCAFVSSNKHSKSCQ